MPGYRWLPPVDNAFIYCDVKTGSLLIAIYSVIRSSLPAINLTCPLCVNFHVWTTTSAAFLSALNVCVFFVSLTFFVATIALLFTLCVRIEIVKPYVITAYAFIGITIIYQSVLVIAVLIAQDMPCKSYNCWLSVIETTSSLNDRLTKDRSWGEGVFEVVLFLFVHILESILLLYFTIVVNSFKHDPEAYPDPDQIMFQTVVPAYKKTTDDSPPPLPPATFKKTSPKTSPKTNPKTSSISKT